MVLDILEQNYKGQYEYNTIDIQCKVEEPTFWNYKTHCAVLVKDNSREEYVIDMWLNPKEEGIFKKAEWGKVVSEIYLSNEYKIETNKNFVTAINS